MNAEKLRQILDRIEETKEEEVWLEFKERIDLSKDNKVARAEFIKDFMALVNAHHHSERYLIIGIKDNGEPVGIDTEYKEAVFQQIIEAYIVPPPVFSYHAINLDDKKFGVLTILRSSRRPHIAAQSIPGIKHPYLNKGEIWIRKGSKKGIADAWDWENIRNEWNAASKPEGRLSVAFADSSSETSCSASLFTDQNGADRRIYAPGQINVDLMKQGSKRRNIGLYLSNIGQASAEDIVVKLSVPEFADLVFYEKDCHPNWMLLYCETNVVKVTGKQLVHGDSEVIVLMSLDIFLDRYPDNDWQNKPFIELPVHWIAHAGNIAQQNEGDLTVKLFVSRPPRLND